jgi:tetratricopeptide (TPR) repeat protein
MARFLLKIAGGIFSIIALLGCSSLFLIPAGKDPLSAEEHLELGVAYESSGELELARSEYERALDKNPDLTQALINLGNVHYQRGDYSRAEKKYQRALKLSPQNGDIHNNLAWVYLSQERFDQAHQVVTQALKLNSTHRHIYLDTQGVIYHRQGRYQEAVQSFKEAIRLSPEDSLSFLSEAYSNLAESYRALGLEKEAQEAEGRAKNLR